MNRSRCGCLLGPGVRCGRDPVFHTWSAALMLHVMAAFTCWMTFAPPIFFIRQVRVHHTCHVCDILQEHSRAGSLDPVVWVRTGFTKFGPRLGQYMQVQATSRRPVSSSPCKLTQDLIVLQIAARQNIVIPSSTGERLCSHGPCYTIDAAALLA